MSSLWNWDPKYTLYDGPNTLITNKLPQLGIIIMCASNIIRKIFGRTGKTSRKFVTFVYFIVTTAVDDCGSYRSEKVLTKMPNIWLRNLYIVAMMSLSGFKSSNCRFKSVKFDINF